MVLYMFCMQAWYYALPSDGQGKAELVGSREYPRPIDALVVNDTHAAVLSEGVRHCCFSDVILSHAGVKQTVLIAYNTVCLTVKGCYLLHIK